VSRFGKAKLGKFEEKAVMMAVALDEQWYTLDEIAERLKVSRRTVNRWVAAGSLRVYRLSAQSGAVRVTESDLRKFLEERASSPPNIPAD
jgi:excisionase family DNA binding protein